MQTLMGGTPMANAPSHLGGANSTAANNNTNGSANLVYPALHLHPLNDTFAPKQISLAPPGPNNRIKIGRQTNAKTVPNPTNGYFDSKVLSRMHAEVWCQDGKVFIKDVRSSNGTFINGERLSAEAQESDVFELHNEDMVEFGIDIVGDDSKTIIHHKVACRVYLVITAEDALGLRNDFASLYRGGVHGGPLGSNGVGPGAEGGLRRGKAGFSFDYVLSKLQNELQKSKDTWNDLGSLNATMHDIHDTLGGGLPSMTHPPYQHMVPAPESAQTIATLQTQLSETQASLATHVDKIKSLETLLSEHETIKKEVGLIKEQMDQARREMEEATERSRYWNGWRDGVHDDASSVASMDTITERPVSRGMEDHVGPRAPPDMPPQEQVEEEAVAERAPEEAPAPTPVAPVEEVAQAARSGEGEADELRAQNATLTARLEELSSQLEQALALSQGLQTQHAAVTDTVKALEERVQTLEKERVTGRWVEFKAEIEEGWRKERETWATEREELRKVVKAWDEANRDEPHKPRKRKVNAALKGLLYANGASSEDEGWSDGSSRESGSTRPSTATGVTSVDDPPEQDDKTPRNGEAYRTQERTQISAAAAGVVVVGVAAWVLAGKSASPVFALGSTAARGV